MKRGACVILVYAIRYYSVIYFACICSMGSYRLHVLTVVVFFNITLHMWSLSRPAASKGLT
jgi:hypothetical protein